MNIPFTPILANFTPTTMMFVFLILLMMFGAKRLPEFAKGLGQAIREFSKAKNEIHDEIMREPAPPVQPPRQIETVVQPPPGQQPAGTQTTTTAQTVAQSAAVPHDHV